MAINELWFLKQGSQRKVTVSQYTLLKSLTGMLVSEATVGTGSLKLDS